MAFLFIYFFSDQYYIFQVIWENLLFPEIINIFDNTLCKLLIQFLFIFHGVFFNIVNNFHPSFDKPVVLLVISKCNWRVHMTDLHHKSQ